jgi:hypothetical protein
MSADDAIALAFAHGLPYAGLRDEQHDSALVPVDVARRARVVALDADDGHVRLAVAEPEPDLDAVRPHLGDLAPRIVIAPRDEIDAILGPPPEPPAAIEPAPIEPAPRTEPVAAAPAIAEPAEEPSWLSPAPERSAAAAVALVLLAFLLIAGGIALAIWVAG